MDHCTAIRWLMHWPLMGGLLTTFGTVKMGRLWSHPVPSLGPTQSPPRCTKCNSSPVNGHCTNFVLFDVAVYLPLNSKGVNILSFISLEFNHSDKHQWYCCNGYRHLFLDRTYKAEILSYALRCICLWHAWRPAASYGVRLFIMKRLLWRWIDVSFDVLPVQEIQSLVEMFLMLTLFFMQLILYWLQHCYENSMLVIN